MPGGRGRHCPPLGGASRRSADKRRESPSPSRRQAEAGAPLCRRARNTVRLLESMNRHPGLAKELIKICLKPRPLAEQSLDGLQLGELAVAVEGGFPSRTIKAIGDERHAVLRDRKSVV